MSIIDHPLREKLRRGHFFVQASQILGGLTPRTLGGEYTYKRKIL